MFDPTKEGITHINAYSKSNLPLGRLLSNWAHSPFLLPDEGKFASVEAYWFWLGVADTQLGQAYHSKKGLMELHGYEAMKFGKELSAKFPKKIPPEEFRTRIKAACEAKLKYSNRLQSMLIGQYWELPIVHYYNYGGKTIPASYNWEWAYWCELRTKLLESNINLE